VLRQLIARASFAALGAYARVAPTERGGYRLVRLARRALPRERWRGAFKTPDGLRMQLDLGTYPDCCMAAGLYELDTYRQIRRHLRPGGWFVDCGANIGYFTMLAARWVGPAGRVDAFEPDPLNLERLRAHLADNALAEVVRVHASAVGERACELDLYHPMGARGNHGMASAYATLVPEARKFQVSCARLDQRLEGVPDLIKIDVEGAELPAITGMAGLLRSPRPPRLIIELNPVSSAAAGYKPSDLVRQILEIQPGYSICWIGWRLHPLSRPEHADALPRQGNLLVQM
jgi:FkbM family methyltransferase